MYVSESLHTIESRNSLLKVRNGRCVRTVLTLYHPNHTHIFISSHVALYTRITSSGRLSGLPFSLSLLEKHLADLSPLHALLSLIQARYSSYFSPDVLNARYEALQQYTPDMPYEERNARFWAGNRNTLYAGRVILMAMKSALGALSVPVYLDLKARLQRLESGTQAFSSGRQPGQTKGGDNVQLLREVFERLRRALVPYAREVVSAIQEGANLGWIMHLGRFSFFFFFLGYHGI